MQRIEPRQECLDVSKSNDWIASLILGGEPFYVARLGLGYESESSFLADKYKIAQNYCWFPQIHQENGIYVDEGENLEEYWEIYNKSLENADCLAIFADCVRMHDKQRHYKVKHKLKCLTHESVEPFYALHQGCVPWTKHLGDKKVLIISPFVESFRKQIEAGFTIFNNKSLWCKDQQFVFYKCFNATCSNKPHSSWKETLGIMIEEIDKLDFDIALVSAGGYGLPLCSFIRGKDKSAIYVGGGLQLMFGVMGKRWENNELFRLNTSFIYPSEEEVPENKDQIEGGCYFRG